MQSTDMRRSREGAWIEIPARRKSSCLLQGRSREGAWIEIKKSPHFLVRQKVAPVRERGLK